MSRITMSRIIILLFPIILTFLLSSCWTINIKPSKLESSIVSLSKPQDSVEIVGHFRQNFTYIFSFFGISQMNNPNLDNFYIEQIDKYQGDGICNLSFTTKYDSGDFLTGTIFGTVGYVAGYYLLTGEEDGRENRQISGIYGFSVANALFSSRTLIISGDIYKKINLENKI